MLLKWEVISYTLEADWKSELKWWASGRSLRGAGHLRLWDGSRVITKPPAKCRRLELKRGIFWQMTGYQVEAACWIRLLSIRAHALFNSALFCAEPLLQAYLNTSVLSRVCHRTERARPFTHPVVQKQLFTEVSRRLSLANMRTSFNSGLYFSY